MSSVGKIFNVKEFGAVGNGIVDDTVSIQAAIDAAFNSRYAGNSGVYGVSSITSGSVPVIYFPFGVYKIGSTGLVSRAYVRYEGERSIIVGTDGYDVLTGVGFNTTITNLVFRRGNNQITINTGNVDTTIIAIEHCEFIEPQVAGVSTSATSQSTILKIDFCKFYLDTVITANVLNINTCDHCIFKDCWVESIATESFVVGAPGGTANPFLYLINMAGIPGGPTTNTWIRNNSGNIEAVGCRFGGENGGNVVVANYCPLVTPTTLPNHIIIKGCRFSSGTAYIKFFAIPNLVIVEDNVGFADFNQSFYFDPSIPNAQRELAGSYSKFIVQNNTYDPTIYDGYGSDIWVYEQLTGNNLIKKEEYLSISDLFLNIPLTTVTMGQFASSTNTTPSSSSNTYGTYMDHIVTTADHGIRAFGFTTALSTLTTGSWTLVQEVWVLDNPILADYIASDTERRFTLNPGKHIISVPFQFDSSFSSQEIAVAFRLLKNGTTFNYGSFRIFKGHINIKTPNTVLYDSGAPGSGNWAVGDIIINNAPTGSGLTANNYGWINTAAGSPGTWQRYGAILNSNALSVSELDTDLIKIQSDIANVATTGLIRFPSAVTAIAARNNANTANLTVLTIDSSDEIIVGDTANVTSAALETKSTGTINFVIGSTYYSQSQAVAEWNSPILRYATGVGAPKFKQDDNSTNSATGQLLTIQAQNATGTTATGGGLTLTSGTGTTAAGDLHLQTGGSDQLTATASTNIVNLPNAILTFGSTPAGIAPIRFTRNNSTYLATKSSAAADYAILSVDSSDDLILGNITNATQIFLEVVSGGTINMELGATVFHSLTASVGEWSVPTLRFKTSVSSPSFSQGDNTTNSATGQTLTIHGQNATGTSATGGGLTLSAGTGTTAAGGIAIGSTAGTASSVVIGNTSMSGGAFIVAQTAITFNAGGNQHSIGGSTFTFSLSASNPVISQGDLTTNSGTGNSLTLHAQNETGTTSTGGILNLASGTGTTTAGNVILKTGGTTQLTISPTINTFVNTLSITALSTSQYVKTDGSKNLVSSATIGIADLTIGSQAQGDVIYFNGTSWTRLGAGTSGQVLTTSGTSANPVWGSGVKVIQFNVTTSATTNSTSSIPANAIIYEAWFKITTSYSGGATVKIGITGTAALFMDSTSAPPDLDPTTSVGDIYIKNQVTSVGGSAATVLVTIGGSPASGAGTVLIFYGQPDS